MAEGAEAVEAGREALREQLIERARKIVEKIAKEREIELVLARPITLIFDPKKDITAEVIAAVDAKGSLKLPA
ncbi:MAG: hypothetical protein GY822_17570 [Deltaproteobacteria bacterium]|nr:hypothetical protein [Deltaproteobacteria bacterium]